MGLAIHLLGAWIGELEVLAARSGMRELAARARRRRAVLGDTASGAAADLLAREIDNPVLHDAIPVERRGAVS